MLSFTRYMYCVYASWWGSLKLRIYGDFEGCVLLHAFFTKTDLLQEWADKLILYKYVCIL